VLGVRPELAQPQLGLRGVAVISDGALDELSVGSAAAMISMSFAGPSQLRGALQRGGAEMT
jgi:hypothetical protein